MILLLVVGSALSAVVPILVGLTAVFATFGLVSLESQLVPMDGSNWYLPAWLEWLPTFEHERSEPLQPAFEQAA